MSKWTHAICAVCWHEANPDREPFTVNVEGKMAEVCCFCGGMTSAGIYTRFDPTKTLCGGRHIEEPAPAAPHTEETP